MQSASENDLTIVAIGASAGGIEALSELMSCLPVDTGMAFVLVLSTSRPETSQHAHGSARQENGDERKRSLRRYASEPNHVFVIPPNTTMSISSQTLHLSPREESHGLHMPIDHFLRALLAEQKGNRAVGVILSGSGSDGTLGLSEIQAHGGVTFAQDGASAKYDGMPRSAVAAGYVDYVLSPKGIARELARIARHPYVARETVPPVVDPPRLPARSRRRGAPTGALQFPGTGLDRFTELAAKYRGSAPSCLITFEWIVIQAQSPTREGYHVSSFPAPDAAVATQSL